MSIYPSFAGVRAYPAKESQFLRRTLAKRDEHSSLFAKPGRSFADPIITKPPSAQ